MSLIPTITIATLVRDRAWVLPYFLKHIKKINYNKDKIKILFVVNNSTDDSLNILEQFKKDNDNLYKDISIHNLYYPNIPEDSRTLNRIKIYPYLAKLRNYILSQINTDYLFSIDSDIFILDEDIISKLVSHQVDIISGWICNGFEIKPDLPFQHLNCGYFVNQNDNGKQVYSLTKKQIRGFIKDNKSDLIPVHWTGAIYLLSQEVCKTVKYEDHIHGEDIGFCLNALKERYDIFTDGSIYSEHIMNLERLKKYKEKHKNF